MAKFMGRLLNDKGSNSSLQNQRSLQRLVAEPVTEQVTIGSAMTSVRLKHNEASLTEMNQRLANADAVQIVQWAVDTSTKDW